MQKKMFYPVALGTRVSKEQARWVVRLAKKLNVSASTVIRMLIQAKMEDVPKP